jgi:hypothetical protein
VTGLTFSYNNFRVAAYAITLRGVSGREVRGITIADSRFQVGMPLLHEYTEQVTIRDNQGLEDAEW